MANANVSEIGKVNNAGTADALFLKVFAGEVLTSFEQATVTADKHEIRTIANGKSAQFPVMGRSSAAYHTPGNEITGTDINHNEKVITINDLLISSHFIANIDEAKNHYDVRSVYSQEMGRALAFQMDKTFFRLWCKPPQEPLTWVTLATPLVLSSPVQTPAHKPPHLSRLSMMPL